MAKEYYQVLGVERSASADQIKQAYRRLSKELHPDKHSRASSEQARKEVERKFKDVNEAYEVLSNPEKRARYDQFGEAGVNGQGFNPGAGAGSGFGGFDFSGFGGGGGERMDFSDLFETFFGGRGAGASGGRRREEKGEDREVAIEITLADVVSGVEQTVRIRHLVPCARCEGKGAEPGTALVTCGECGGTGQVTRTSQSLFGMIQQTTLCPRCQGSGKVPEKACKDCSGEGRIQRTEDVVIQVPAGIDDGQTLRLRGKGDAGRRGAPAGDLYVHVRVKDDPRFIRDGADIRTRLELPVVGAILGTEIPVETVHGSVTLSVPAGTQPSQVFRIRGKGLPILNASGHGDHYVTVDVEIPKKLGREERKLLEEWRKLRS